MVALVVVVGILVLFIVIGTYRHDENMSNVDFFLMNRAAKSDDYADTTIAYSLQVAVTIYFIYWGYAYGWSNLFFVVLWGIGFFLFALAAPRLAYFLGQHDTYFRFLMHGSRGFQVLACVLFGSSLIGLLYTELFFSSQLMQTILSAEVAVVQSANWFWISFLVLLVVVLFYASLGGMRKVVFTDKWQLAVAYLGAALLFAGLAPVVSAQGLYVFLWAYLPVVALFALLAAAPTLVQWAFERSWNLKMDPPSGPAGVSAALSGIILLAVTLYFAQWNAPSADGFPKPIGTMLAAPWGIWPIIGFGVSNIIWQFSDYTAYHRLSIMNIHHHAEMERATRIKHAIFTTMLNSPLTWSLGIFAGMAIDASRLLPQADFGIFAAFSSLLVEQAAAGSLAMTVALVGLCMFIVAALLSTVDSGFMSIGQIVVRDLLPFESGVLVRIMALWLIGLAVFALALAHSVYQLNVFNLLSSIYSWSLIFAPIAAWRLFRADFHAGGAMAALVVGAGFGAIGSFNPLELPALVALVFPTLVAVGATTLSILVVIIVRGNTPSGSATKAG